MKNKRRIAAFFTCFTLVAFANLSPSVAQTNVAIVDIGLIFKSHPTFTRSLEELRLRAESFKATSLKNQQNLMRKAEVLKQYKMGTAEYSNIESQLAQESAALEVSERNIMRDLMRQEATLHYDTYFQVKKAVAEVCSANGCRLVLRYNSQEMDLANPATILQKVNSNVVFHNPQSNLTTSVISRLRLGTANASPNPTTQQR